MIGNTITIKKTPNLLLIEEMFGKIKAKIDIDGSLKTIKKCLQKEYDVEIKDIIITDQGMEDFYGMRTYYDRATVTEIVRVVKSVAEDYPVDEESRTIDERAILKRNRHLITERDKRTQTKIALTIEIDPILLWSKTINLTPAELTSVLLHEVGHYGIHSYEFICKVRTALLISLSRFGLRGLALIKALTFNIWAGLGILLVSELMVGSRCTGIKYTEETLADRFVIERGYGNELQSVLGKLIEARYMERYDVAQFRKNEDKDLIDKSNVVFNMSLNTISQLDGRKDEVRRMLSLGVEKSKGSPTFTMYMKEFMNTIFSDDHPSRLINMMSKQNKLRESLEIQADVLAEGLIDKLFGRKKSIGARDLDSLRIEVEMVNDYYDKIDVVDKIHAHIGATVKYIEYLNSEMENPYTNKYEKDKVKKELYQAESIRKDLLELLDKAMSKQIVEKQYGVFVKVPKGYEG